MRVSASAAGRLSAFPTPLLSPTSAAAAAFHGLPPHHPCRGAQRRHLHLPRRLPSASAAATASVVSRPQLLLPSSAFAAPPAVARRWNSAGTTAAADAAAAAATAAVSTSAAQPPLAEQKKTEAVGVEEAEGVEEEEPFNLDRRVYNVAVSSLLMGSGIGVIVPVMPLFATSLGVSPAGLGMVVAVMGAARLFTNVPAAWAADRYGRKPLMVIGPVCSAAGTMLCCVATGLPQLLLFRAMSGFGGSVQMTGSHLYLADISKPENRARTMAPLAIAFSMGMALGPVAGGILAEHSGLAAPFLYVGGVTLVAALNNYMTLSETRAPSAAQRDVPLKDEVLKTFRGLPAVASSTNMRAVLALHSVYWGVTSGAMFALLPVFAAEQFGLGVAEIGKGFTALAAINLVGARAAAKVSDRYGRKAVAGPAVVMMAASTALIPFAPTPEALGALWMVWGAGATCLGTAPTAYAADVSTEQQRGQAMALLRSSGDLGLMVGAGCIGFIAKYAGVVAGFWTGSVLLTIVGLNFCLRAAETVGKYKSL